MEQISPKGANYISAFEFMEMLKAEGLVIVSLSDLQISTSQLQSKLMKRKSISLTDIINSKLLPLKSSKGIIDWIKSGKIKEGEWYQESSGKKRIMIMTLAIKRLGWY